MKKIDSTHEPKEADSTLVPAAEFCLDKRRHFDSTRASKRIDHLTAPCPSPPGR